MTNPALKEAAEFLGLHPVTLQQRAKSGVIPGAKIGRSWRFLTVDLVAYLRAQYPSSQHQTNTSASILRSLISEAEPHTAAVLNLPDKQE